MKNLLLILFLIFSSGLVITSYDAYGHGVGSEIFPPVELNGKLVSVEVSSSTKDDLTNDDQQISISLIDFDSKITLRDVTFLVKSERGEQFLFEKEFKADHGFLVFNFISEDTDSIVVEEKDSGEDFFGSLLGLQSRLIDVKGPKLSEGGLYKLDISIITADGYSKKLETPLVFNAGISIAQTTTHDFVDPDFGNQNIQVVTYYDEISNFQYDPNLKKISYFMPFEWTLKNINQTSVVHEEIIIPKDFGALLLSGFSMSVNGIELSDDIVNVDDFFTEGRVVHFIIYQKELLNIFENSSNLNGMNFVITPDRDYTHLSSVTDNGQFRILVHWEPEILESNSDAKILFDITDIFLKNKPVSTNYEFSITQNDRVIFEKNGISSNSKENHNIVEFMIPSNVSGIVNLNFNNLDNNNFAKTVIPIVIDREIQNDYFIPSWIKNNAGLWSDNVIDDETFVNGIEYLIQNQVIIISPTISDTSSNLDQIPSWIKNNAGWWTDGTIDDETFVNGMEYLVQTGVIQIN
ncbi:peptidase [Nitrosopumilus sp. Nsub]|uniref:peptidase n=1 Tax=Nitrosopumilus sp. Nsub TaxID=1776294 RepID=UPI000836F150|nr:peptidase [Nitrosopumilus sp. Nsub]